jgi:hypothetical protein
MERYTTRDRVPPDPIPWWRKPMPPYTHRTKPVSPKSVGSDRRKYIQLFDRRYPSYNDYNTREPVATRDPAIPQDPMPTDQAIKSKELRRYPIIDPSNPDYVPRDPPHSNFLQRPTAPFIFGTAHDFLNEALLGWERLSEEDQKAVRHEVNKYAKLRSKFVSGAQLERDVLIKRYNLIQEKLVKGGLPEMPRWHMDPV